MAEKARLFRDEETRARILRAQSPDVMKKLGRQVRNFDERVWDAHCEEIVFAGNMAKFSQNPDLLAQLMDTKGQTLVEASPFDRVWGIGLAADHANATRPANWEGQNKLGEVLMRVREQLRAQGGGECGARQRGQVGQQVVGDRGAGWGGLKRARGADAQEAAGSRGAGPGQSEVQPARGGGRGSRATCGSRRGGGGCMVAGWGVSVGEWWGDGTDAQEVAGSRRAAARQSEAQPARGGGRGGSARCGRGGGGGIVEGWGVSAEEWWGDA